MSHARPVRRSCGQGASGTRSGIPRRSVRAADRPQGGGRAGAANGNETEVSRIATNSTRVTNATELAKQGWRPNAVEASGSGLRPEDRLVSVERSQGRVAGPSAKVSQPRQIGRTFVSHDTPPTLPLAATSRRVVGLVAHTGHAHLFLGHAVALRELGGRANGILRIWVASISTPAFDLFH